MKGLVGGVTFLGLLVLLIAVIALGVWALVTPIAWYLDGVFGYAPSLKTTILALFVLAVGAGVNA